MYIKSNEISKYNKYLLNLEISLYRVGLIDNDEDYHSGDWLFLLRRYWDTEWN